METQTGRISEEVFRLWLTRSKTTKDLFRWQVTPEDAFMMMKAAYEREVEVRGMDCRITEEIAGYLSQVAGMMTSKSSKCGILLCGNCGNGKTTTMNAFLSVSKYLNTQHLLIESTTARRISQIAKSEDLMNQAKRAAVLCIDDIGLEPTEVLDYGNAINPVIEIIEHRYRQQLFTFITTNLTPQQIREKYGDRVADRFNEIMRCIVYKNSTFRR